jgi:hypothetical protein
MVASAVVSVVWLSFTSIAEAIHIDRLCLALSFASMSLIIEGVNEMVMGT